MLRPPVPVDIFTEDESMPQQHTNKPPVDPEPVRNIDQLTDTLWVGGDLPEDDERAACTVRWWHRLGIRTVIDTRAEWSDEQLVALVAADIEYVHLGQDDVGQRIHGSWFDAVTDAARAGDPNGGVLTHCHMGINRGPSAAFAVLLDQGWDLVEAIDHIRQQRPIAAVGYAEDALDWWHRRQNTATGQRRTDQQRLELWRSANPHETIRIIRQIRLAEAAERRSA